MSRSIQNVIFDIGNVLLQLDYSGAWLRFTERCPNPEALREDFQLSHYNPHVAEYEKGLISLEDLFVFFEERTGFHGTAEEFAEIWSGIFTENVAMIEFGRRISATHGTYIMSNCGPAHVPAVYDRFPSMRFFRDDALSYELGELKPTAQFYEKGLAKMNLRAKDCIFIDDLAENAAGARAVGLHAVHHVSTKETIRQTEKLLSL